MLENSSRNLEKLERKENRMSDIDVASSLLGEVAGNRGPREQVSSVLERAYSALKRLSPHWTRRRVKSIWYREATRVDWREIEDMRLVLEARKKHAEYKAETARIVAMAVSETQIDTGGAVSWVRQISGGMDSTGAEKRGEE